MDTWREQRKVDKIKQNTLKKRQFNRDSSKWRKRQEREENSRKRQDTLNAGNNSEKLREGKVKLHDYE